MVVDVVDDDDDPPQQDPEARSARASAATLASSTLPERISLPMTRAAAVGAGGMCDVVRTAEVHGRSAAQQAAPDFGTYASPGV